MTTPATVKLSRLLNLVALLSEARVPLTARDIRERIDADYGPSDEAFRQAFERDKAELRQLGIEIVLEEVPGTDPPEHGYRVPRSQYALRDPGLDPDEAAALHLAASLVRFAGVGGGTPLWKLGGPADEGDTDGVAELPQHPQLGPLFTAVAERRTANFGYRGRPRAVDPYRLDFARGHWYLAGRDREKDDERVYRVDRIDDAPLLGAPGAFKRPASTASGLVDPWLLGEGDPVVARLRIDPDQAAVARTTLGEDAVVEEADDGTIVVELEVTHIDGFRSFVLGFLDHAEVLAPPELRDDLVAWLQQVR